MNRNLVSAVFDTHMEAERAVSDLHAAGVENSAISLIAQHDGKNVTTDGSGAEAVQDVVGKTALGAGLGTLLGVAALAIPGVGPLVAAGTIAAVAVPGAALTGAAIGAAAGGVAGLLTDHGVDETDEPTMKPGSTTAACSCRSTSMMQTSRVRRRRTFWTALAATAAPARRWTPPYRQPASFRAGSTAPGSLNRVPALLCPHASPL